MKHAIVALMNEIAFCQIQSDMWGRKEIIKSQEKYSRYAEECREAIRVLDSEGVEEPELPI